MVRGGRGVIRGVEGEWLLGWREAVWEEKGYVKYVPCLCIILKRPL